jgi:transposase InsO family protein
MDDDFTYVPTWSGTVYVAFVIDVFARRIVGPLSADLALPNRLPVNGTNLDIDEDTVCAPLSAFASC